MIDWLIIYGTLMGALRLLLNHHQPVEPWGTSPYTAKGLLGLWVRLMLIAFIIIQGFHLYWIYPYLWRSRDGLACRFPGERPRGPSMPVTGDPRHIRGCCTDPIQRSGKDNGHV